MRLAGPPKKYESCLNACDACPYGGPRVGSRGNPKAPIVFIGEAPGTQELTHKIPLVGPSGEVFWRTLPSKELLEEWGITLEDDILILNATQCRPPSFRDDQLKNQASIARGAAVCRNRLIAQVLEHPRKVIVAMGNSALRSLTGDYGLKITQVRGQLLQSNLASVGIIPAVHPAALLRGTGNYRQFRADVTYAIDLLRGVPPKAPVTPKWFVARNKWQVAQICNILKDKEYIACDTETGGFNHLTDEILSLGLCSDPSFVYIIPGELVSYTRSLFGDSSSRAKFIWQNGKFDMRFMRRDVGDFCRVDEDTMLLSYTLDESGGIHDLEQIAGDLVGAPDYKHMLKPWLPNKKTSYRVVPKDVLHHYLALDTSNTLQIFHVLRDQVNRDPKLRMLYEKVLIPYSEFLYRVETRGITIRKASVERQRKRLIKEQDAANLRIQKVAMQYGANQQINPNSPKQLSVLLFDILKLRPPRLGSRSTAKEVLDKLQDHPVVKALVEFRKASKALSTYVVSLDKNTNIDGRVHATYLIHGTRTGRLSSRGPNMQNIPRDARLRGMYMAAAGMVFIKVDLNQAELRSLACLSNDSFLVPLYLNGSRSLHKETAIEFYGPNYNPEQLMRAKAVNFGIVYGRTAPSLSEEYGTSTAESQRWIDKWFNRSPEATAFIKRCRAAPQNGINLVTAFGRKKRHWLVTRENLQALQNEASNFPHQSIASEICTLGAAKAAPLLRPYGIYPVNVVHDEAMFECPDIPEVIAWAQYVIVTCMESIAPEWGITKVPFRAEASVGKRWSIYRKGKEHEYPYEPQDMEAWWQPPKRVEELCFAFLLNQTILGIEPEAASKQVWIDDHREGAGFDPADSDWSESDGATAFGFAPTDGPDSSSIRN